MFLRTILKLTSGFDIGKPHVMTCSCKLTQQWWSRHKEIPETSWVANSSWWVAGYWQTLSKQTKKVTFAWGKTEFILFVHIITGEGIQLQNSLGITDARWKPGYCFLGKPVEKNVHLITVIILLISHLSTGSMWPYAYCDFNTLSCLFFQCNNCVWKLNMRKRDSHIKRTVCAK